MPGRPKRVVASTGSSNTGAKSPPVANSDANERTTLPNTPAFSGNRDDDENKLKQQPPAFQQDPSLPLPAAREDGTEVDHEEVTVQEGTDERKRSSRQSASSHDRGRRPTPDPTGEEDQEKSQMEGAACVEDEEGPGLLKSLSYIVSIVTDHIDDEQEKIFHLRDNRPVHFAAMNVSCL